MGRPQKGPEPLSVRLQVKITQAMNERLVVETLAASSPQTGVLSPADVAREALGLGLDALEKRRKVGGKGKAAK